MSRALPLEHVFEVGATLGEGGDGTVFRATPRGPAEASHAGGSAVAGGTAHALKVIRAAGMQPNDFARIKFEADTQERLSRNDPPAPAPGAAPHPPAAVERWRLGARHVVSLIEKMWHRTFYGSPVHALVLELAAHGDLFGHVADHGGFVDPVARTYLVQLCLALRHIHANGVVHRDLKPENVVLDADYTLKVTDFGWAASHSGDVGAGGGAAAAGAATAASASTSKSGASSPAPYQISVEELRLLWTKCGTPTYMAPELFNDGSYVGPPIDVWGAGVMLFAMVAANLPMDQATYPDPWFTSLANGQFARFWKYWRSEVGDVARDPNPNWWGDTHADMSLLPGDPWLEAPAMPWAATDEQVREYAARVGSVDRHKLAKLGGGGSASGDGGDEGPRSDAGAGGAPVPKFSWLCVALLSRMLELDPMRRITFAEVLRHPYITAGGVLPQSVLAEWMRTHPHGVVDVSRTVHVDFDRAASREEPTDGASAAHEPQNDQTNAAVQTAGPGAAAARSASAGTESSSSELSPSTKQSKAKAMGTTKGVGKGKGESIDVDDSPVLGPEEEGADDIMMDAAMASLALDEGLDAADIDTFGADGFMGGGTDDAAMPEMTLVLDATVAAPPTSLMTPTSGFAAAAAAAPAAPVAVAPPAAPTIADIGATAAGAAAGGGAAAAAGGGVSDDSGMGSGAGWGAGSGAGAGGTAANPADAFYDPFGDEVARTRYRSIGSTAAAPMTTPVVTITSSGGEAPSMPRPVSSASASGSGGAKERAPCTPCDFHCVARKTVFRVGGDTDSRTVLSRMKHILSEIGAVHVGGKSGEYSLVASVEKQSFGSCRAAAERTRPAGSSGGGGPTAAAAASTSAGTATRPTEDLASLAPPRRPQGAVSMRCSVFEGADGSHLIDVMGLSDSDPMKFRSLFCMLRSRMCDMMHGKGVVEGSGAYAKVVVSEDVLV